MDIKKGKNPRYEKPRYGEEPSLTEEFVVRYGEKKGTRTVLRDKRGRIISHVKNDDEEKEVD